MEDDWEDIQERYERYGKKLLSNRFLMALSNIAGVAYTIIIYTAHLGGVSIVESQLAFMEYAALAFIFLTAYSMSRVIIRKSTGAYSTHSTLDNYTDEKILAIHQIIGSAIELIIGAMCIQALESLIATNLSYVFLAIWIVQFVGATFGGTRAFNIMLHLLEARSIEQEQQSRWGQQEQQSN